MQKENQISHIKTKKIMSMLLLMLAGGLAGIVLFYHWCIKPRGVTWLSEVMEPLWICTAIICVLLCAVLWLPFSRKAKRCLLFISIALCIVTAIIIGSFRRKQTHIEISPDRAHMLVLEENNEDGTVTVNRPFFLLFKRMQEQFPYTVKGKMKYQWLEEDICAVTYQSPDTKVHQYIAAFGDRGDGISYLDPLSALEGHWAAEGINRAGYELTVEKGVVTLTVSKEQWQFEASDCVRVGTTAIALCEEGLPQFSIAMNKDCSINSQDLIAKGGTLTVCPVSMEKTAPMTFVCTDAKEDEPEIDMDAKAQAEQDKIEKEEKERVEKMRALAAGTGQIDQKQAGAYGIFYVPVMDQEETWNVRTALKVYGENFRVNGVDVRVQLDSIQRLAGSQKDGLYEVVFTELCITPGNQGAGPTGEKTQLTYKMRMMQAAEGYYAYVAGYGQDGSYGLSRDAAEPWLFSDKSEYHYFLSGEYDTQYMYVSRRDPRQGMEALYEQVLKSQYPGAVIKEYDGMPYFDLTGEGTNLLLYDGISEDYQKYCYQRAEFEQAEMEPGSRMKMQETYQIAIQHDR